MKVDPRSFRGLSRFLAPSAGGPLADRALAERRITVAQLEECIAEQDRTGRPLDEILVARGHLSVQDVTRFRNPPLPAEVDRASRDPQNVLGHYVLVSRAGMGGMAEVWKAWDTSLGRWVAVKFLKDEVGHPTQRIEREGKMAGQLSHPGIITIYERGLHEGRPYLVMPLVNGAPPKAPLAPREAARLVHEVAQALIHAHKHGVIHRDVKPANVLVESGGRVVLADFGLAIRESAGASRWAVSGTPEYASPEQILGGVLDRRTDVYSLGATLYQLLSGHPPFSGATVEEITDRVLHACVAPLTKAPRALARIVARAMERERAQRYPSMEALDKDLRSFLDPVWGSLPGTPKALVAVLVAGTLPWLVTGFVAWRRSVRDMRNQFMEAMRPADGELSRTELLWADPDVPLATVRVSASETLRQYLELEREFDLDPPEVELAKGRCLELMGEEQAAEKHYRTAGRTAAARLGLARIRLRRHFEGRRDGDWRKEAARELDGIRSSKSAGLAELLYEFASGQGAQLLARPEAALDLGRHDDVFQMALGVAAAEQGKWADAAARFDQAARLRRNDPTALYWKGVALAGKGEPAEAAIAFDQALQTATAAWPLRQEAQKRWEEARR